MGQTYATITTSADAPSTTFTNLKNRTDTLRSSFSGGSSPGSPVQGQLWCDSTSGTDGILSFYDGDAWVEIGSALHTDLSFGTTAAPKSALHMRLENRTAHIAPGAAQVGRAYHFTTDGKGRLVVSATEVEVIMSANNTDYFGSYIPIGACDLDATNPPTPVAVGTTPAVRGMEFNATNEKASFGFFVPAGYSADADCKVRVWAYLSAAETNLDTIDATLDIRTIQPNNAEVPTGTSTQSVVAYVVTTAKGVAQYTLYVFDFTIDFDQADNPVLPGDWVECEFALSSVASVAGLIVRGFMPLFTFGTKTTE